MTATGLAAFGVADVGGYQYLYDSAIRRIIAEGAAQAVRAKVAEWEPFSPGRYTVVTASDTDPGVLLEWQRFKAYNQYWVIGNE